MVAELRFGLRTDKKYVIKCKGMNEENISRKRDKIFYWHWFNLTFIFCRDKLNKKIVL